MKRIYSLIACFVLVLTLAVSVCAFTNSSNLDLHIPEVGDPGSSWGDAVSNNFEIIDQFFCDRVSGITASRLAFFDPSTCIEDGDLLDFVTGVNDRTSIQTDGSGGVFINTPQDIGTTSDVIFNSLTLANTVTLSDLIANRIVETGATNSLQSAQTAKLPELGTEPSALASTGQLFILSNGIFYYMESDGTVHEVAGGTSHSHGTLYNDDNEITLNTSTGDFEILNGATAGLSQNTTVNAILGNIVICNTCKGHYTVCGGTAFRSTTGVGRDLELHAFQNGLIINSAGRRRTTTSTGWGSADIGCPIVNASSNDYFELRLHDTSGTPADIIVNEFNFTVKRLKDGSL